MVGTALMSLDTNIITVATPKIATEFQTLGDVGWYGAAYITVLTAFTPISANIYKLFDPKYVYLFFVLIFEGVFDNLDYMDVHKRLLRGFFCVYSRNVFPSWLDCLCSSPKFTIVSSPAAQSPALKAQGFFKELSGF